jgi:cellobiose-specific phosphotransferase system component IIB
MVNVTLVCVAGVSGTFLARRLRELDPQLSVTVTSLGALAEASAGSDIFLIAPQLVASLTEIETIAADRPTAVLEPEAYSARGADQALHAVRRLTGSEQVDSLAIPAPTKE